MIVRRERPGDEPAVRDVQAAAFRQVPGEDPAEARLLDELRRTDAWLPRLSLVAESADGAVVGHVVCTRAHVDDWPVVGLGPIGVRPDHQLRGIGAALVHAVVAAAEATGEPLIGLLGSDVYYGRFGFVPSTAAGVEPPEPHWGAHFQVRTLAEHDAAIRGRFRYASPFDDV